MKTSWRRWLKVAGIVLLGLVVVLVMGYFGFLAYMMSPRDYDSDRKPEGAANNYLLAIFRGDFERAYAYLSPELPNYPESVEVFKAELGADDLAGHDLCPYFESMEAVGERVVVKIRYQYYDGCVNFPLNNLSYNHATIHLQQLEGRWVVVEAGKFFNPVWLGD